MTLKRPKGLGEETAGTRVVLEHSSAILKGNGAGSYNGVLARAGDFDRFENNVSGSDNATETRS